VAERKIISTGKTSFEVEVVAVTERKEFLNEYALDDGAVIRVSNPAAVVYKVVGSSDQEGHPTYLVKLGTAVTVVDGPKR
jgi:hypothetical protein